MTALSRKDCFFPVSRQARRGKEHANCHSLGILFLCRATAGLLHSLPENSKFGGRQFLAFVSTCLEAVSSHILNILDTKSW